MGICQFFFMGICFLSSQEWQSVRHMKGQSRGNYKTCHTGPVDSPGSLIWPPGMPSSCTWSLVPVGGPETGNPSQLKSTCSTIQLVLQKEEGQQVLNSPKHPKFCEAGVKINLFCGSEERFEQQFTPVPFLQETQMDASRTANLRSAQTCGMNTHQTGSASAAGELGSLRPAAVAESWFPLVPGHKITSCTSRNNHSQLPTHMVLST